MYLGVHYRKCIKCIFRQKGLRFVPHFSGHEVQICILITHICQCNRLSKSWEQGLMASSGCYDSLSIY